jgi:c-di-AMP phosphodiesterase-like protein
MDQAHVFSPESYKNFVKDFFAIVSAQFDIREEDVSNNRLHNLVQSMPMAISLVNTLSYLRWGSMMVRPITDNQNELYEYENIMEKRIHKLIQAILSSQENEYYKTKITEYLVKFRTQ